MGSHGDRQTASFVGVAERPARAENRRESDPLLGLHRSAGNRAVAALVQRSASGEASSGLPSDLAARIRGASGRGSALPVDTRSRLEGGLGADLGGVRVHTDSEADQLNRTVQADAFTSGRDVFFRSGAYAPSSSSGFRLLAHETAHVVQQTRGAVSATPVGGGIAVSHPSDRFERAADQAATTIAAGEPVHRSAVGGAPATTVARSAAAGGDLCIQRHSSWEHMLIGDLKPEELATLGTAHDAAAGLPGQKFDLGNGKKIESSDVEHVIEQEMRRLTYFQRNPPTGGARDVKKAEEDLATRDLHDRSKAGKGLLTGKELVDKMWDVKLVAIPSTGGRTFMVTYGEMNTLADFFGSVTEMSNMDPSFLDRLIRGVRQSTANELVKIYMKVSGTKKESDAKKRLGVESRKFKSSESRFNMTLFGKKFGFGGKKDDAIGMGGGGIKGIGRELNLMGALPLISRGKAKPVVGGKKESDYSSTLARNACHFAPESWHSWQEHHDKALGFADDAYVAKTSGNDGLAADKVNEALLYNGFGDHYLQDSYAAGHLINKTQIMSFYTKWLDKQPWMVDFHKNKNWRKVQDMAYGQSGLTAGSQYDKGNVNATSARNPQAVANSAGGWQDKAAKLGLTIPPSVRPGSDSYAVLTMWQAATLDKWRKHGTVTVKELVKQAASENIGVDATKVKVALGDLVADGVIRRDSFDVDQRGQDQTLPRALMKDSEKLVLREAYIPKNAVSFSQSMADPQKYEQMAMGVQYDEYLDFMNSSFLQKSTNALHNKFCEEGLTVSANAKSKLFKIYGDDAMFQKGASAGLLESGLTAQLSRDAIVHTAESGKAALPYVESSANILNRLPAYVEDESSGGARISLAEWHNAGSLEQFCDTKVFPKMGKGLMGVLGDKFAPGAISRDLGKIDDRPDKRDLF